MSKIEDRAIEYAMYQADQCAAYDGYVKAATEQRDIDIKRACEWIEDCFGESYIEYFRKAMEL